MNKLNISHNTRWRRNREHWEATLDSANLGAGPAADDLRRQVELYETADVRFALDRMEPLDGRLVMDLGGGLALGAILMARRGARVVITDIAHSRLRLARENLRRMGLEERVWLVAASADAMPFADGAFDAIFTKSVLIHTPLREAAAECARVLAPDGRAAFIEPLRRNPFVNLYRRLAAPRIWREITNYFGPVEIAVVRNAMRRRGLRVRMRHFFFLGFFASVFAFALKNPRLYRVSERGLMQIDKMLFRMSRRLKQRAWFGVILVRGGKGGRKELI